MISTGLHRKASLLLLASVLVFPCTASAGPRPGSARTVEISASAFLEDLFGRAWTFLTGAGKEGCHIDPDGRCVPRSLSELQPTIQTDTGCHIDPDGRCRS